MELHLDTVQRIAARALADGATRESQASIAWDVAGRCETPVERLVWGRPEGTPRDVTIGPGTAHSLFIKMQFPCRKCYRCLRYRAALWTGRAAVECATSYRTWFGTLTLTPQCQYESLLKARHRCAQRSIDFDALQPEEQFRERCAAISREITLYLKRVRKESGSKLRILCVAEHHKSGDPHWHALVHQISPKSVTYRCLTDQWPHGFTKWKLVKQGTLAARYVCKYLTKASEARVRASLRYGEPRPQDIADISAWNPTPETLTLPDGRRNQAFWPEMEQDRDENSIPDRSGAWGRRL